LGTESGAAYGEMEDLDNIVKGVEKLEECIQYGIKQVGWSPAAGGSGFLRLRRINPACLNYHRKDHIILYFKIKSNKLNELASWKSPDTLF